MKKKLLGFMLTTVMVTALTGCGNSGGGAANLEQGNESGGSGSGNGSLSVAIWDNNQLKGLQQIADEWSNTSGVDVEFEVMDWTTYWTMLEAGVSGGEMPDVFWMHSAYAQMYTGANVLKDLNSYIENDDAINLTRCAS